MLRNLLHRLAPLFLLLVVAASSSTASTVTILASSNAPNGAEPQGATVFGSDGTAYGTAEFGGTNNLGTIYAINSDGSLKWLYSFDGIHGENPQGALSFAADGNLYGVTPNGGAYADGVLFRITPAGSYHVLHSFQKNEGSQPNSPLAPEAPDKLLGSLEYGGAHNDGALFQVSTSGPFSVLHQFSGSDGSYPSGGLTYNPADKYFYGATAAGGVLSGSTSGDGTIFRTLGGSVVQTLHTFSESDGASPTGGFYIAPDSTLYGVTQSGGLTTGNLFGESNGLIFKISANETFSIVHEFDGSDGALPFGGLALGADGRIYGVTEFGGPVFTGTVYGIDQQGQFSSLSNFEDMTVYQPTSGLSTGPDGMPYGVTENGVNGGAIYGIESGGALNSFFRFTYPAGVLYGTPPVQAKDGDLLGVALEGGDDDNGAIYELGDNGKFSSLHSFDTATGDGGFPIIGLVENKIGEIFGLGYNGGANEYGTLFQVDSQGDYSTLFNFNSTTGSPTALTPAMKGSSLYGASGSSIFSYTKNGNFSILAAVPSNCGSSICSLVQGADDALFGTTVFGGKNNAGTLFRMTLGGHFTVLYNFTKAAGTAEYTNLIVGSDGLIYGTTFPNGSGYGEVFSCSAAGAFTVLHAFAGGADGGQPFGGLVETSPGLYYGTEGLGGTNQNGTVYSITAAGSLTTLYSFDESTGSPYGGLLKSREGSYYGAEESGAIYQFQP